MVQDIARIRGLWDEFFALPFPDAEAFGDDDDDAAELDGAAAGCVLSFLDAGGELDRSRTAILGLCYRDVAALASNLEGPARDYFLRLEDLIREVLEALR